MGVVMRVQYLDHYIDTDAPSFSSAKTAIRTQAEQLKSVEVSYEGDYVVDGSSTRYSTSAASPTTFKFSFVSKGP